MKTILFAVLLNLIFSNTNISMQSLLFCIKNTEQIHFTNHNTSSNKDLNVFIESINNSTVELWLPGATNKDIDNNINLSKIYRLKFPQQNSNNINSIKETLNIHIPQNK